MKKVLIIISSILFSGMLVFIYYTLPANNSHSPYTTDFARIEQSIIHKKETIQKKNQIVDIINKYKGSAQKISIAGKKYSGGGHTFSDGVIVIDMSDFNNIIEYDAEKKKITVEAGMTWGEIQNLINIDRLSIQVMQSSNIFSVGGSLSSNIHGRDPKFSTIVDSVESFRLITADGKMHNVSREENKELFGSVIGGFGLLGVITDVTLHLTEDFVYEKETIKLDSNQYSQYLKKNIIGNNNIGLHFGRFDFTHGENFFSDFHFVNYKKITSEDNTIIENINKELMGERNILRNRFFFNLSRDFNWAKDLRWFLQKSIVDSVGKQSFISRNNAMRPPIEFISYKSEANTDILHEYFIPLKNFNTFIDIVRKKYADNNVNLLSVTTRYVPKGNDIVLNYNTSEMIGIVLYMNVGLSDPEQKQVQKYTRELIEQSHKLGGTYYLVYQNYASKEQMRSVYPGWGEFLEIKQKYDPNGLFTNKFYESYK